MSDSTPSVRCAIYTRKSSEEGLEQSFNSLDAQREACLSFIVSQKHEGWRPFKGRYDDGGFSGGTMERPALKKLIEDVRAGRIDTVVVYKVDRLTRSLADFAKIIEIFDSHKVSFISVTQQFNTTTSMGRLALNVLLSFAQFEREVTGERIRDKIAASKRKGMWMGGSVPLGYDVKHRMLLVNRSEAERVREFYRQYLKVGCVSKLKIYLEHNGINSKRRTSQTGRKTGGVAYSRGALYNILQNRIYVGEIAHRGQVYPGEHKGIVPRELWEQVQARLRANNNANQNGSRAASPSLLVSLVYDHRGNRFTPAHAVKNGKRYRYYVSQAAIKNPGSRLPGPTRIPAAEIENLVRSKIQSFLASPQNVVNVLPTPRKNVIAKQNILAITREWSKRFASATTAELRPLVRTLISRIVVDPEIVDVHISKHALRSALLGRDRSSSSVRSNSPDGHLSLKVTVRLERCGGETRFVLPAKSGGVVSVRPVPSLIKAIVRARGWYTRIIRGELISSRSIAIATGLDERYVNRIFPCAFLAPDIVDGILDGRQPPGITLEDFRTHLPMDWPTQRQFLGFPAK